MGMRKIINRPENFVDDTMDGIIRAYGDKIYFLNGDKRIVISKYPRREGKVGLVTAGGSGHLPLFLGYVGQGMLDGCAVGNVFASPSAERMENMIRACDFGKGVLCLYGNYGGDRMNLSMAMDAVEFDDIQTRAVFGTDDLASSPAETKEKRRGVAGIVYAYKTAGAAAEAGLDLDEVARIAQKTVNNVRTLGIALSPCIVPEVGKPTFMIEDDMMEIGMGIHGEPGIASSKIMTADEVAKLMVQKIDQDMPLKKGDEVSVMMNSLGATPKEELLIVYGKMHAFLEEKGVKVFMPHIGEYATSMEMAGMSGTILKLDEELKGYLSAPARTPFYTNMNI